MMIDQSIKVYGSQVKQKIRATEASITYSHIDTVYTFGCIFFINLKNE